VFLQGGQVAGAGPTPETVEGNPPFLHLLGSAIGDVDRRVVQRDERAPVRQLDPILKFTAQPGRFDISLAPQGYQTGAGGTAERLPLCPEMDLDTNAWR
jgi:hypothetical protein